MKLAAVTLFSFCAAILTDGLSAATPPAPAPVTALAFSPDGAKLLVGRARQIQVWNAAQGKLELTLPIGFAKVTRFDFHPAGNLLAIADGNPGATGAVTVLDWPAAKSQRSLGGLSDLATAVRFNRTGATLLLTGADRDAKVLAWPGGETRFRLEGHAGPILAAAYSPDDLLIVTASADRSIKVWDAATGALRRSFSQHTDIVHDLSFRPRVIVNGEAMPFYCASAGADKTVRVWQPEIGRMVRIVRGHEAPVFAVAYSRDGQRLYSAGQEGIIRVIDGDSDEILHTWKAHEDWIYAQALSPDGTLLASGDWKGSVRLWDLREAKPTLARELR